MNDFKVWIGGNGKGSDRVILITKGFRFYFSTRWFGWRLRLVCCRPYIQLVRA
jgi:hypothetical protein